MFFPKKIIADRIILQHPQKPTFKLAQELYTVADASRNSILPWLAWPDDMKCAEDEFVYLNDWVHKKWIEREGCSYIIRCKKTNNILGGIDFLHIDEDNRSGEIGYWLATNAVGNGFITEALQALENVIFQLNYNRIIIRNDTRNIRSVNVAKRNGYHLDGIMRQIKYLKKEKCFIDINIWSKIKDDIKTI
jgi:ribosomal-protein-serine acetyltransferase